MEIKKFFEKNKLYCLAFIIMGVVAFLSSLSNGEIPKEEPQAIDSVDTMIPKGHILIPLELENLEQISSLIGSSGVVDLYTAGPEVKRRRLVASRIKIVQAPFNSQVYAALIREFEADAIQNYLGPFRAAVHNPKQQGSRINQSSSKRISIFYQR
jgi:hypothetical protein